MVTADAIRLAASATLGLLSISGHIELWQVFVLAAAYGAGEALFYPALGALVPEVVPRNLLVQANALDGFVRPLASRLVGPALGGVAIEYLSVGGALLLDAGSFVFSITALLFMRPLPRERGEISARHVLADIHEGFVFVRAHTWLWGTLLAAAAGLLVFHRPVGGVAPFLVRNDSGSGPPTSASSTSGRRRLDHRCARDGTATAPAADDHLHVHRVHDRGRLSDRLRRGKVLWPLVVASAVAAGASAAGLVVWSTLDAARGSRAAPWSRRQP